MSYDIIIAFTLGLDIGMAIGVIALLWAGAAAKRRFDAQIERIERDARFEAETARLKREREARLGREP